MTITGFLFAIYAIISFVISFRLTMRMLTDGERDIGLGDFMFFVMASAYFGAVGILVLPFFAIFKGIQKLANDDLSYAAAVLSGQGKAYKARQNEKAAKR